MKTILLAFGLVAVGLLFSAGFDDMYIRRVESQDPSQPVLVQNCDPGGKEPTWITVKVWTPNPFGESTHAFFYYKNFTTGGWVQIYDCSVLQYGKECQVHLPLYLGGMGDKTESLEVIRATMEKGSTRYEATMEISLNHVRTDKEKIVENKTATYRALYAEVGGYSFCDSAGTLCCKLKDDYESVAGLEARSEALQKECQVDAARILMENAINTLNAIKRDAPACSAALSGIANAEQTANQRNCNSGTVRAQIDALKAEVRNGDYELDLSALNSAIGSQCGGLGLPAGLGGSGPAGPGQDSGSQLPASGSGGQEKPFCPGMFVLMLLPLALVVFRWDF